MKPDLRSIKGRFPGKSFWATCIASTVVLSVFVGMLAFLYLAKKVEVNQDGQKFVLHTLTDTFGDVLKYKGFRLVDEDYVSLPLDTKLQMTKNNEIHIKKAVPVTVEVDGKKGLVLTAFNNVGDAIKNGNIVMSEKDKFDGVTESTKIKPGMTIRVVRVEEKFLTAEEELPFKTKRVENTRMAKGEERTVKPGENGKVKKEFKVVLENGKMVAKSLIKETVMQLPVSKIVEFGTLMKYNTSRGDELRFRKSMDMKSTAYTASYADTGKHPGDPWFGITATGVRAKRGIIAVDPRVIPLGTKVYVEVQGSMPDYGYAVAADTGGAIKGNIIDVYLDTSKEVRNWGRRNVKVYILD